MPDSIGAYLGLGANVGPARHTLERAVSALAALPGAAVSGVSQLYRTRPVGPVAQGDFFNAVVHLQLPAHHEVTTAALALLAELKRIERDLGREERERWGPREVDIDLLLFGEHVIHAARPDHGRSDDRARAGPQWLEVPHPAASDRLFVLAPLAELAPDLRPPGWGLSVAQARERALAIEGRDAAMVVAAWDAASSCWVDLEHGV